MRKDKRVHCFFDLMLDLSICFSTIFVLAVPSMYGAEPIWRGIADGIYKTEIIALTIDPTDPQIHSN